MNSPRVKLSLNDTILLDGRDTEIAFADFIFAFKRKNVDFPDIYYTKLDVTGINPQKVINKDAKKQRQRELDSFQNLKKPSYKGCIEMEKPHMDQLKIYKRQVGYPKKDAYFLHSKDSYKKYRHATRHFKRLPAFAKRINEIWCLDLAFVDKLSDTNNGVKYLLVCVDVFSRFVLVKPKKSKYSSDAVVAFKKILRKKSTPAKVWVDQGTEFSGEFRKFCTDKKINIYSTRSETKAAVAERATKSLKNIIYRHMEENGDKYMRKMDSFLKTMNTRVNRSTGKAPKIVTNKDFLSIFFYKNSISQYKRPRFKVGENVRISKKDIPFRKGYKSQFTKEIFKIVKIASFKPPTYNLCGEQGVEILVNFYEQEFSKCII